MTQGNSTTEIKLNEQSIKVNPENYLGMIYGCGDNNIKTIIHVSTDTSWFWKNLQHGAQYFLLTAYQQTDPSQPAVEEVINLWERRNLCESKKNRKYNTKNIKGFAPPNYNYFYNHVVCVDALYNISTDEYTQLELFSSLCDDGFFMQWMPDAPLNRLHNKFGAKKVHQIGLFRVYKVDKIFHHDDLNNSDMRFYDELLKSDTLISTNIFNPVIPDEEFQIMKTKIKERIINCGAMEKEINLRGIRIAAFSKNRPSLIKSIYK